MLWKALVWKHHFATGYEKVNKIYTQYVRRCFSLMYHFLNNNNNNNNKKGLMYQYSIPQKRYMRQIARDSK